MSVYTKNVRFDVARNTGDRAAPLAAYMRGKLTASKGIRMFDRSLNVPGNGERDFQWKAFPVQKLTGTGDVLEQSLEDGSATKDNFIPIFGALRDAELEPPGDGDDALPILRKANLTMILSEFTFTGIDGQINAIRIGDPNRTSAPSNSRMKTRRWRYSGGTSPLMRYRVYIGQVNAARQIEDLAGVPSSDDAIYPYSGGPSTNSVTDVSYEDFKVYSTIDHWRFSYYRHIPIKPFTVSNANEYAIYFVPVGVDGAYGVDLEVGVSADSDASGYASNSVYMLTRGGTQDPTDLTGVRSPQADTGQQFFENGFITLVTGTDALYYLEYDTNGKPLQLQDDAGSNQSDLLITNVKSVPNASGVETPMPFKHDLRYDIYNPVGFTSDMPVDFRSVTGETISHLLYKLIADSSSSREQNLDAFKSTLYLTSELGDESFLGTVSYTRILDGAVQVNFNETVNPLPVAKENIDYTIDTAGSVPRVLLSYGGSLSAVTETDNVWVKKERTTSIYPLPPLGNPIDAWYPRIHAGSFIRKNSYVDTVGYRDVIYHVPELSNVRVYKDVAAGAVAASGAPYVGKALKEDIYLIDPFTIQMPRTPVYFWDGIWSSGHSAGNWAEGTGTYPNYPIPNIIDPPEYTGDITDSATFHGINIYINGALMDNSNIFGWNQKNGIINLIEPIKPDQKVTATYLYESNYIELGIDLNPTQSHAFTNRVGDTIRIVARPLWSAYESDTADAFGADYGLAWHWMSDNPSGVYSYNWSANTGTSGYPLTDPAQIQGIPLSVETEVICDYTILDSSPYMGNMIDGRRPGGGIKDDDWFRESRGVADKGMSISPYIRERIEKESMYYWDIGSLDGEAYQADGTIIVSVPSSIKSLVKTEFLQIAAGATKVTPDDKTLVEGSVSSGTIDTLLTSISDAERVGRMQSYSGAVQEADQEAIEYIKAHVYKHIGVGQMAVIVDETNTILDGNILGATSNNSFMDVTTFLPPVVGGRRNNAADTPLDSTETTKGEGDSPSSPPDLRRI